MISPEEPWLQRPNQNSVRLALYVILPLSLLIIAGITFALIHSQISHNTLSSKEPFPKPLGESTSPESLILPAALRSNSASSTTQSQPISWIPVGAQDQNTDISYVEENGNIYYVDGGGSHHLISGADASTFFVLVRGNENFFVFAKDKNNVYWFGTAIDHADPKTFRLLLPPNGNITGYGEDKNTVYFFGGMDSPYPVVGADTATFEVLDAPPCPDARDKKQEYCAGTVMQ